jgi:hypothetical protein
MATRSQVKFADYGSVTSNVYVHWDGYPDGEGGRLAELQRFFQDVKEQCGGVTNDAEFLAAKYIVWKALEQCDDLSPNPLKFSGIGPCLEDHGDIEYIYLVDCTNVDPETGFPTVDYKEAGWRLKNFDNDLVASIVTNAGKE